MSTNGIKAVAFDVDGTLITGSIWTTLHAFFEVSSWEDTRLFAQYIQGTATFAQWTRFIETEYLKHPHHRTEIDELGQTFEFISGAQEVVATLRARYPLAVISSGFDVYVNPVARSLSIPHAYAFSTFTYDAAGRFTGIDFSSPESELEAKVEDLKDFCMKAGVLPHEVAFIGDSVNDRLAFEFTEHGILVGQGTPELRAAAWKQVDTLPEILGLL